MASIDTLTTVPIAHRHSAAGTTSDAISVVLTRLLARLARAPATIQAPLSVVDYRKGSTCCAEVLLPYQRFLLHIKLQFAFLECPSDRTQFEHSALRPFRWSAHLSMSFGFTANPRINVFAGPFLGYSLSDCARKVAESKTSWLASHDHPTGSCSTTMRRASPAISARSESPMRGRHSPSHCFLCNHVDLDEYSASHVDTSFDGVKPHMSRSGVGVLEYSCWAEWSAKVANWASAACTMGSRTNDQRRPAMLWLDRVDSASIWQWINLNRHKLRRP
jgi:hypothetical protein